MPPPSGKKFYFLGGSIYVRIKTQEKETLNLRSGKKGKGEILDGEEG